MVHPRIWCELGCKLRPRKHSEAWIHDFGRRGTAAAAGVRSAQSLRGTWTQRPATSCGAVTRLGNGHFATKPNLQANRQGKGNTTHAQSVSPSGSSDSSASAPPSPPPAACSFGRRSLSPSRTRHKALHSLNMPATPRSFSNCASDGSPILPTLHMPCCERYPRSTSDSTCSCR